MVFDLTRLIPWVQAQPATHVHQVTLGSVKHTTWGVNPDVMPTNQHPEK